MASPVPVVIVAGLACAAVLLSWMYFRRFRMERPPIGVVGLWDVGLVLGGIILVPLLYLALPRWLGACLLTASGLSALYFVWQPVLPRRWQVWAVALAVTGADVVLATRAASALYLPVNDLAVLIMAIGIANLWAQGGLKARDAAILAGAVACYDLVATGLLPLTSDLMLRLVHMPFEPLLAWPAGAAGAWVGIGLGDLLLAAMFPLVMRKAFGRAAGLAALAVAMAVFVGLCAVLYLLQPERDFPTMVVLGPLMVLQYLYWRTLCRVERTTWQYLQAEDQSQAFPAPVSQRWPISDDARRPTG